MGICGVDPGISAAQLPYDFQPIFGNSTSELGSAHCRACESWCIAGSKLPACSRSAPKGILLGRTLDSMEADMMGSLSKLRPATPTPDLTVDPWTLF
jgi:hypothetical protein